MGSVHRRERVHRPERSCRLSWQRTRRRLRPGRVGTTACAAASRFPRLSTVRGYQRERTLDTSGGDRARRSPPAARRRPARPDRRARTDAEEVAALRELHAAPRGDAGRRRDREPRARHLAARARPPRRRDPARRAGPAARRPTRVGRPRDRRDAPPWSTGWASASASTSRCCATRSAQAQMLFVEVADSPEPLSQSRLPDDRYSARRQQVDRWRLPSGRGGRGRPRTHRGADRDRAGAVGDRGAVERVVGAVVGARPRPSPRRSSNAATVPSPCVTARSWRSGARGCRSRRGL